MLTKKYITWSVYICTQYLIWSCITLFQRVTHSLLFFLKLLDMFWICTLYNNNSNKNTSLHSFWKEELVLQSIEVKLLTNKHLMKCHGFIFTCGTTSVYMCCYYYHCSHILSVTCKYIYFYKSNAVYYFYFTKHT